MFEVGEGPAWSVITSSQISLNFAMYVRCAFGLIERESYQGKVSLWPYRVFVLEDDAERNKLAEAWERWWNKLIQEREMALLSGQSSQNLESFNPPDFDNLGDDSGLTMLCRRAWPPFLEWWTMPAGGQFAVAYWEQFSNLHLYIRQFEEEIGRKVKPFKLNIDLVYTGLSEPIDRSSQYAIMGIRSEPFMDAEWWKMKLVEIG